MQCIVVKSDEFENSKRLPGNIFLLMSPDHVPARSAVIKHINVACGYFTLAFENAQALKF